MHRKQIIIIVGVAIGGFLIYRYLAGRSAGATATATDPNAASNYAQLAGQEQSDMAQLQQQEQSDRAALLDQIQSLVGTSTPYQQLQAQLAQEHLNYTNAQAQLTQEAAGIKRHTSRLNNQDKRLKRHRTLIRNHEKQFKRYAHRHPHGGGGTAHLAPNHHGPKPGKHKNGPVAHATGGYAAHPHPAAQTAHQAKKRTPPHVKGNTPPKPRKRGKRPPTDSSRRR